MIGIIDYKAGNLHNLKNALEAVNADARIIENPDELEKSEKVILPGVGGFGFCRKNLIQSGFENPLRNFLKRGKHVLGICVGMQLLFGESEENPDVSGLGLISGKVVKFSGELKIPQIGWNSIRFGEDPIFEGIPNNSWFYFVHSYFCRPESEQRILGETEYTRRFCSIVKKGKLYGFQFHPEKSHSHGLRLLKNFCELPC